MIFHGIQSKTLRNDNYINKDNNTFSMNGNFLLQNERTPSRADKHFKEMNNFSHIWSFDGVHVPKPNKFLNETFKRFTNSKYIAEMMHKRKIRQRVFWKL